MKKEIYEAPMVQVLEIEVQDVLAQSPTGMQDYNRQDEQNW